MGCYEPSPLCDIIVIIILIIILIIINGNGRDDKDELICSFPLSLSSFTMSVGMGAMLPPHQTPKTGGYKQSLLLLLPP